MSALLLLAGVDALAQRPTVASTVGCKGPSCLRDRHVWELSCNDGTHAWGAGPETRGVRTKRGARCSLLLEGHSGEAWRGCHWNGFGQSFALSSGYKESFSLTV